MITEETKALLRRFMDTRIERDELRAQVKIKEQEYDELELDVYDAFLTSKVKGQIKVDLGDPYGLVAFRTRSTPYGKVVDEEAFTEWLKQQRRADEVITKKVYGKAQLNEFAKEANEQKKELPPGMDYHVNRGMTVTVEKGS